MNTTETFLHTLLRSPGHERRIEGKVHRGVRFLELMLVVDGAPHGVLQIRSDAAPIIARAIDHARTSGANTRIGSFVDGRFAVEVSSGPNRFAPVAIYFRKIDEEGVPAGRAIVLTGEQIDALETALRWLAAVGRGESLQCPR